MNRDLIEKIYDKLDYDWLIELLLVRELNHNDYNVFANRLINDIGENLDNINNSYLKYFINDEVLIKELKNNEYDKMVVIRLHIEENLKNNFNEIIDKFLINEFGIRIENVFDYINIRKKLFKWADNEYRKDLIIPIIKHISEKFNFDDLILMLTNRLISILSTEQNLPTVYELYKALLNRTIIKLNDSDFWRFYFFKLIERLEELNYNDQERYIVNILNKSFANKIFELKI
jgi:hypothetical protein